MKSAIVTGATGFIGIHLTEELLCNGVAVTAVCRKNSGNIGRLPSGVRIATDYEQLETADVFYHLAWGGVKGSGHGDSILQAENVKITLEALLTAHKTGCGKFVALGSVYEQFARQIMGSDTVGSSDFYILSKKYACDISNKLALKAKIPFIWCTIGHAVGRYIKSEHMMAYVISNLIAGKSPEFGPAQEPYDIVAVEDVAHGLYLAGKCDLRGREYYVGSGAPRRLYEYLEETRQVLGIDTPIGIGERPDDGLRYSFDWFDTSSFMKETGYVPKVSFADSVETVSKWIRENV